jgi:hypothetical protein
MLVRKTKATTKNTANKKPKRKMQNEHTVKLAAAAAAAYKAEEYGRRLKWHGASAGWWCS